MYTAGVRHHEAITGSILFILVVPVFKQAVDILNEENRVARNAGHHPLEIGVIHTV
jgi:pterin-4a-carbinolamine dehydratase